MRIVHLADTHLGFRQLHHVDATGRNVREQDVYRAFERAIDTIVELKPDAVIHAGDLFDSYHPSSAALGVALDGLRRLREAGIPVVIIAGNHSTPRVAAAEHIFGVLERFGGVHVVYRATEVIEFTSRDRQGTWPCTRSRTTTILSVMAAPCARRARATRSSTCWSPTSASTGSGKSSAPRPAR